MEDDWIVAFEATGPGVIWRVWSALPGDGHVQVFIDDAPEPVVDMPFRDFFEQFNAEIPPLNFPSLMPTLSRGRNRFIPIPYNSSCKVRLAQGWGAYYHFTYTTLPPGTQLPRFSGTFDHDACIALAVADRTLAQRGWTLPRSPSDTLDSMTRTVLPGETVLICDLRGNRAITGMRVAPHDLPAPPGDQQVLRELTLSITWDDDAMPSVWSPLGDFFGTAPGVNYYRSLPLGMTDASFYSHWFMPFAERAQLVVTNDGETERTLTFQVCHKPLEQPAEQLLRFHAKWHRDAFLERPIEQGRDIDWPLLLVEGQGRFCGMHLHVWNRWADPTEQAETWWYGRWNQKSIDWWWGEGDEKFFVDGEMFPSTFGTGSEDYVGYAWAAEPPFPIFDSPYAAQPFVALDGNGHTSVSRFHVCDDVPFHTRFEAYIEKYKCNRWGDGNICLYAAVVYWYHKPGGVDPYGIVPLQERIGYDVEPGGAN